MRLPEGYFLPLLDTGILSFSLWKNLIPEFCQEFAGITCNTFEECFSISLAQGKHLFILVVKPHRKYEHGDNITIDLIDQPVFMVYPSGPRS